MPLAPGARLGAYEILSPIGSGGMGEVYRARDAKLARDVAIKILPEALASDPDRIARFEREARTLAALNETHIAHVYGFEIVDGVHALVMELVEGPTLADRIARGPLPIDEALPIARQIAEALEAAHEQGIIHRDLKPANVKLRADGTVKLLDFGLAKAFGPAPVASANATMPPTLSLHATQAGAILGTAAYMSPEQARGKAVDRRTDIWAFGCVLFEMLTGRRPFHGDSMTDTLAAIVKDEPDISAAPPRVHRLLQRCLEKDPKKRLRDIGDAWDLVDSGAAGTNIRARGAWIAWSVAGALALAVVLLAIQTRTAPRRPTHLFMQFPEQTVPMFFALSPDGRQVAINTVGHLEIHSLDSGEVRTLNGTETPRAPFWSPDSRTIAFFSRVERKLKTVSAAGGVAQTLCDNVDPGSASGTWNADGTIVFSQRGPLMRTSAAGGSCTAITGADPGVVRGYPVFLPDGDHFLYAQTGPDQTQTGVFVGSLRDSAAKRLLPDATGALFAPGAPGSTRGRLLFGRGQTLMAALFDTVSLTVLSDPALVADHVSPVANGMIAASVDAAGTLMYLRNGHADRQLAWLDRAGTTVGRPIPLGTVPAAVSLSPDGRRAVFVRDTSERTNMWLHDFQAAQEVFFRSSPAAMVWSPDGQRVAFSAASASAFGIFVRSANGNAEQQILRTEHAPRVSDWSRDGRWILYSETDPRTGSDIWLLPAPDSGTDAPTPVPLLRTPATESQAQVSPDGKWLAYTSDETGTEHVYVRPFSPTPPLPETKWQVSSTVGREPRWRADSRELYYLEAAAVATRRFRMMAVPVSAGATPVGAATALFDVVALGTLSPANVFLYSPAPDGQRFLVDMTASDTQPTLDVILNWARADK